MKGGSSNEQHNAEIQKLKEQCQRTTEEERKKITEIMCQQNLKFEDLLKEKEKREQLISELRKENVVLKGENVMLKDEISGVKLAERVIEMLVNKLVIVGKEDADEDRCSVAKLLLENGHGRELRKIRKLLTCEEFDAEEETKLEMFLSEDLGELSNGRVKKAFAAILSAQALTKTVLHARNDTRE